MATSTTKFTLLSDEIRLASQALNAPGDDISLQEKQMLLVAARELVDKLEGPEIAIWRVVFGVSSLPSNHYLEVEGHVDKTTEF